MMEGKGDVVTGLKNKLSTMAGGRHAFRHAGRRAPQNG
jgi:hypothetical protein